MDVFLGAWIFASILSAGAASPHLMITEVMSSSAETLNGVPIPSDKDGPDWWELTNYGTNAVDLTGYRFSDDSTNRPLAGVLDGVILPAHQSLILSKTNRFVHTVDHFVFWWWTDCRPLPNPMPQILLHDGSGLGSTGDEVWLFDPSGVVVDSVVFGPSTIGRTFIPNPDNGSFGSLSGPTTPGGWQACTADDFGSPGWGPPPLPVTFLVQPQSKQACLGSSVELTARAVSLPKPRYQWYRDDVAIPNATQRQLLITAFQPSDVGFYHVVAEHSLGAVTSEVASVEALVENVAPAITRAPASLVAFPHQSARFEIETLGCPLPTAYWLTNGVLVEGLHGTVLEIPPTLLNAVETPQTWAISVVVSNAFGVVTNLSSVHLTIDEVPQLVISEFMSAPSNSLNTEFEDWMELTNLGRRPVPIQNYRLSDFVDVETAFRITNDVVVLPGESIILVDRMSPQEFRDWWGDDQLPPRLKVITWSGFGYRSDGTEPVVLWNAAARENFDYILATSSVEPFDGVSLIRDDYDFLAIDSELGYDGTIESPDGLNYGSPGMYLPVILGLENRAVIQSDCPDVPCGNPLPSGATTCHVWTQAAIRFWGMEGRSYRLLTAVQPGASIDWIPVGNPRIATEPVQAFEVMLDGGTCSQWYRIEEITP